MVLGPDAVIGQKGRFFAKVSRNIITICELRPFTTPSYLFAAEGAKLKILIKRSSAIGTA